MLKTIINSLEKVKATDVVIYNMKGYSPLFDYIIISTVDSSRQSDAVTSYLKDDLAQAGYDVRNIEGKNTAWVLVDCHEVLVHVFTKEEREYFSLEKIYMDIPTINVNDILK
ncbi:MAG: ribosome silencing factor [Anaeroplasmataceae bacterium]